MDNRIRVVEHTKLRVSNRLALWLCKRLIHSILRTKTATSKWFLQFCLQLICHSCNTRRDLFAHARELDACLSNRKAYPLLTATAFASAPPGGGAVPTVPEMTTVWS